MLRFQHFLFILFLMVLTPGIFHSCKVPKTAQTDNSIACRVAFYNVENLFDTLDNATTLDDDFTPDGRNKWNTERYFEKINNLAKVISAMGYPGILGLCEVENDTVVEDLIQKTSLKDHNYQYIHFQSPDERGIDNALIYRQQQFNVLDSKIIRIDFPDDIDEETTRDILYVKGKIAGEVILHVFVNHWPSRRGGVKASEPKRLHVAGYLRKAVDEIFVETPNANILIMGDFNDEPNNRSLKELLGAHTTLDDLENNSLYNCLAGLGQQGKGTYNYQGQWNLLDNLIVSTSLASPDSKIKVVSATIFWQDWMMYNDPKNGMVPSRSYGGPNYYGGYSDHLPVFMDIVTEKN